MQRIPYQRTRVRWRRGVGTAAALALVAGAFGYVSGPAGVQASSHREAPLIAGDPRADNTDVYAFVSADKTDSVTLIANWIPFEEPNGGPNFYTWADDTRYNIKIDNDGDAKPDLTYTWIFDTVYRNAAQHFLYNTGPVTSLTDPDLNVYQTYDLTVTNNDTNVTTNVLGDGNGVNSPGDPIAAPSLVGPGSIPDYKPLRDQATYAVPGGGSTYAGQADDSFFADLRVFDLLYGANATEVGQDTLANYNVNSIALQVPKTKLAINGNATTNPVIGVWSTTDRRSASVVGQSAPLKGAFVQVSRLGNPLVNEVVIPLSLKNAFNAISPDIDATIPAVVDKVNDPILPKLIQSIYGVPAPATPRNDLVEIFLQGISKANAGLSGDPAVVLNVDLNSQGLNADAQAARGAGVPFQPSEMLRLNMAVAPAARPNRLGVLAGDVAGFPNGRRLTDDVLDIAIQAVEGAAQAGALVAALAPIDSVDRNDSNFGATFPYLAMPHNDGVNLGVDQSPRAPEFIPLSPLRVLDTRQGGQLGYSGPKPAAGQTVQVKVTGLTGSMIPDGATAAFLNVTAVNTVADGFVTAYACGSPQPLASSFNPSASFITHNLVVAPIGPTGNICLFTNISTDLIGDLSGYVPSDAKYVPTVPQRVLETRVGAGQIGYTGAKPALGAIITLHVTGTGAANIPADAKAAFLNVTSVNSAGDGYLTVYPCGATVPNASTLNLRAGFARATLVAAKIGTGGNVCIFASNATDVIADLQGYAPANSSLVVGAPERILETRPNPTVGYSGSKPIAGQTIELKVTGVGATNAPASVGAVWLNVTTTDNTGDGFVTVYPCGSPRPNASSLNLTGFANSNMVSAKVGEGGRVCIYTSASTHLIADLSGYYPDTVLTSAS